MTLEPEVKVALVVLIGSLIAGAAKWMGNRWPQTPAQNRETRITELEADLKKAKDDSAAARKEAGEAHTETAALRREFDTFRNEMGALLRASDARERSWADYASDLRSDYVRETGKPARDYPESVTRR